ncbi:unnamed protein product [Bursaphelenchus okinawaensis]|uniref:G protein-coupled receptor n=1 Tax=Bursaphelenchus okinawaensis TaxID=465554 RepID=A0A811KXU4_9BILA|nr:unnamed protein product [Bursaphelenchus okinawaensis]CAG9113452.1 unnamed protein product [Bursaphelenchus okinawaensis]
MLRRISHCMSEHTKQAQRQVQRIVYVQVSYPVMALFIPMTVLPIVSLLQLNIPYIGKFEAITRTTPLFNSLAVIWCVPLYRNTILKIFGKRFVQHQYKHSITNLNNYVRINNVIGITRLQIVPKALFERKLAPLPPIGTRKLVNEDLDVNDLYLGNMKSIIPDSP